jgi:hypothetical protein
VKVYNVSHNSTDSVDEPVVSADLSSRDPSFMIEPLPKARAG